MKDHWYYWRGETLCLRVHITPQSRHDAISGLHNNRLSIKLHAPPVDGKANKQLISMLAHEFDAAKSGIWIAAGAQGRDKLVCIDGPRCLPAWYKDMTGES